MVEKKASKSTKKNSRKDIKYPALDPKYNLKTRFEEIEDMASYMDQLNEEEKAWLNAFSNEEVCANFNHSGPKLNDVTDAATRSRIYNRNNARNRCIFSQELAQGTLNYIEELDKDDEEED